ncbi:MAG: hypothetical protein ACEQSK_20425 [Sphingomonadaceae bacterium]
MLLDGQGTVQVLVRNAARNVGLQVEFRTAPAYRCLEEMKRNLNQGYPVAAHSVAVSESCTFPMQNHAPDPQRATVMLRAVFYRRVGAAVGWDGKQLTGVQQPVLTQRAQLMLAERLRARGIRFDQGASDAAGNFAKLIAGRGELALAYESDAQPLLKSPPFAEKIEALPVPFLMEPFFLCLSRPFRDADPERAERLWNEIGRLNNTGGNRQAGARMPQSP